MKQLFAFCLLGAMFASCGTVESTTAESADTTVVTAAAPVDTVVETIVDSTTIAVPDSIN